MARTSGSASSPLASSASLAPSITRSCAFAFRDVSEGIERIRNLLRIRTAHKFADELHLPASTAAVVFAGPIAPLRSGPRYQY